MGKGLAEQSKRKEVEKEKVMQALTFLFIFALALGGACQSNSRQDEIPPPADSTEAAAEPNAVTNKGQAQNTTTANSQNRQVLPAKLDTLYLISGTEPFWSLAIARPQSVYTSADGDTLLFDFKEARTASARPADDVQVFELGRKQELVLRKNSNCPCSDGMSNKAYPYQATLILAEKILEGCGRMK